MQTLLLYLLVVGIVAAVIYALVWFVFGRAAPIEPDTTLTELPWRGSAGTTSARCGSSRPCGVTSSPRSTGRWPVSRARSTICAP